MMPTSTQAGKCIGFWILSSVMCVTDINNCTNTTFQKFESKFRSDSYHGGTYLLKAERAPSFILIKLPSLELLHCLFHSQLSHLHPLLQRDELPLSRCLHACKGVMVTAHVSVSHQPYRSCKNG